MLKGKRFGVLDVSGGSFALTSLLVELGMEPLFIRASKCLEHNEKDIRDILDAGFDPLIIPGENSVEIDRVLKTLMPDFLIPFNYRDINPATAMGVTVKNVEAASSHLGFERSVEIARLLSSAGSDPGALSFRKQYFSMTQGI